MGVFDSPGFSAMGGRGGYQHASTAAQRGDERKRQKRRSKKEITKERQNESLTKLVT